MSTRTFSSPRESVEIAMAGRPRSGGAEGGAGGRSGRAGQGGVWNWGKIRIADFGGLKALGEAEAAAAASTVGLFCPAGLAECVRATHVRGREPFGCVDRG